MVFVFWALGADQAKGYDEELPLPVEDWVHALSPTIGLQVGVLAATLVALWGSVEVLIEQHLHHARRFQWSPDPGLGYPLAVPT